MNLDLTEDQIQIRDAIRDLCQNEFAPKAADWDQSGDVPRDAVAKLAELGCLGMAMPEDAGGLGYDARTIGLVIEEIAEVSAALAIMISVHNSVGAFPIYEFGTGRAEGEVPAAADVHRARRVLAVRARCGLRRRRTRKRRPCAMAMTTCSTAARTG